MLGCTASPFVPAASIFPFCNSLSSFDRFDLPSDDLPPSSSLSSTGRFMGVGNRFVPTCPNPKPDLVPSLDLFAWILLYSLPNNCLRKISSVFSFCRLISPSLEIDAPSPNLCIQCQFQLAILPSPPLHTLGEIHQGCKHTYSSGTGVNNSCSSLSKSSSDFAFASSETVGGGSHEATSRWDSASATEARLKMMSASEGGFDMLF